MGIFVMARLRGLGFERIELGGLYKVNLVLSFYLMSLGSCYMYKLFLQTPLFITHDEDGDHKSTFFKFT